MKKRMMSALLALVLCFTLMSPTIAASTGYSDVPENHWAAESIRRATQLGIFQGMSENIFGRGQAISRAAFVTALVRLFGWAEETPAEATFTDVTAGKWYYTAVETAVANGAVVASGKLFRPTEDLTRGEMTAMLIRAMGYTSLAGTVSSMECPFSDVTTNKGFITLAYDLGIVDGVGEGRFDPNAGATREQAAAILVRMYDKLNTVSREVTGEHSYTRIEVETPEPVKGAELPTTPLEPIAELYAVLREMKRGGADMSKAVLCLTAGGVRTTVSQDGRILSTDTLSAEKVRSVLIYENARPYYSERYESAYCIYEPNFYQTVIIWYQSEESMAAKLQLALLFGVIHYILE